MEGLRLHYHEHFSFANINNQKNFKRTCGAAYAREEDVRLNFSTRHSADLTVLVLSYWRNPYLTREEKMKYVWPLPWDIIIIYWCVVYKTWILLDTSHANTRVLLRPLEIWDQNGLLLGLSRTLHLVEAWSSCKCLLADLFLRGEINHFYYHWNMIEVQ